MTERVLNGFTNAAITEITEELKLKRLGSHG